jgi:hypothetical protein
MRSLERAHTLLARHTRDSDAPVIGTTNLIDPAEMISGWCLYDLGGRVPSGSYCGFRQTAHHCLKAQTSQPGMCADLLAMTHAIVNESFNAAVKVNIHVPGARDWRARVVMRCGGFYGGSGMGGIQGLPASASWMAVRTWAPCLATVEM